ncbi:Ig-like domain-containing protein [Neobacillus drentensis]|uniref:Ig-like domain-containing protein n=1 Tax=Neobacillus drentensis TaxID=220684 RepID=UPI002FFFE89C
MKKMMLNLILASVFLVVWAPKAFAVGELQLPTISQISTEQYDRFNYFFLNDQENLLVADYYDYYYSDKDKLKIVKASQGTTLQSFDTENFYYFTANDSNTYFVAISRNSVNMDIFNSFGEKVFYGNEIPFKDEVFSDFGHPEFIPNTNILVMTTNGSTKLVGFDVDKQQIVFYRNIPQMSGMALSSNYIAISGGDNTVNIYDTNGEYIDTILSDMNINTVKFTADGKKLVLGGDADQLSLYDVDQAFTKIDLPSTQFKTYPGWVFNYIDIDKSGKYLVAITSGNYYSSGGSFIMFDFKTGQQIYTNLDYLNDIKKTAISSDGKYILVDGNVYSGKNLIKRVTQVSIPSKYLEIQLGSKTDLSLLGVLADGTTSEIKTGITWATSDFNVAYLLSGKLVAQKIGSFDLKAKYLGFDVKSTVQVIDTLAPVKPVVNQVSDKDNMVTGQAEPESTIEVKVSGSVIGTEAAGQDGNYKVTIPVQTAGMVLEVIATDAVGNESEGTIVQVIDKTAPSFLTVDVVSDKSKEITGKTEPGATVSLLIGTKINTAEADTNGNYKVVIPILKAGTKLIVAAKDTAGNVSAAKSITVLDKTAPVTPTVITISDQTKLVTGKVEAGSIVTVTIGTKRYVAKADTKGNYKVTIPVQKAGIKVIVTAKDTAENVSVAKSMTVIDKTAPLAPKIKTTVKSTTKEVTGTAEAYSTITVKVGSKVIGTAKADSKGNFKVKIKAQKRKTVLSVIATDKAKNVSKVVIVRVK